MLPCRLSWSSLRTLRLQVQPTPCSQVHAAAFIRAAMQAFGGMCLISWFKSVSYILQRCWLKDQMLIIRELSVCLECASLPGIAWQCCSMRRQPLNLKLHPWRDYCCMGSWPPAADLVGLAKPRRSGLAAGLEALPLSIQSSCRVQRQSSLLSRLGTFQGCQGVSTGLDATAAADRAACTQCPVDG